MWSRPTIDIEGIEEEGDTGGEKFNIQRKVLYCTFPISQRFSKQNTFDNVMGVKLEFHLWIKMRPLALTLSRKRVVNHNQTTTTNTNRRRWLESNISRTERITEELLLVSVRRSLLLGNCRSMGRLTDPHRGPPTAALAREMRELRQRFDALEDKFVALQRKDEALQHEICGLQLETKCLRRENTTLRQEIAALKYSDLPRRKRPKIEHPTLTSIGNDATIQIASFLDSKGIAGLSQTCQHFGKGQVGANGLIKSLAGALAEKKYDGAAEYEKSVTALFKTNRIKRLRELELFRVPLTFQQLIGREGSIKHFHPHDQSTILASTYASEVYTAIGSHVMSAGKHYVQFSFSGTNVDDLGFDFGVIRPIKGWDKKGLDEFNPFERKELIWCPLVR